MYLYKINNSIYPNKYFGFVLTVDNLDLAPAVHSHSIDDVEYLTDAINEKADKDHEHNFVDSLFTDIPNEEAESINVSIVTNVIDQNDTEGVIEVSNNTIGIKYISPKRGVVDGAVNKNGLDDKKIIRFFTGDINVNINDDVCMITMKEN